MRTYIAAIGTFVAFGVGTASLADVTSNLVVHYPFDGSAFDHGPNAFHGTTHGGLTYSASGRVGGCAQFNGTDAWVGCNHGGTGSFDIDTQSYTVAAWVRIVDPNHEGTIAMDRFGLNTRISYHLGYHPVAGGANDIGWSMWWGPSNPVPATCAVGTQPPLQPYVNSWHHIAAVFNHVNRVCTVYIDGEVVQTVSVCPDPFPSPNSNNLITTIGGYWGSCECMSDINFFKGDMDDFRIYSRPLSPADIQELVRGEPCRWDLDGDGALTMVDLFTYLNGWFSGCP